MIYHIKSHLTDQNTLEIENLILFNHVIIDFKAIFMNYMHEQVCKDDENKNLKTKKNHQIIDSNINFFFIKRVSISHLQQYMGLLDHLNSKKLKIYSFYHLLLSYKNRQWYGILYLAK
eukprot:297034_1